MERKTVKIACDNPACLSYPMNAAGQCMVCHKFASRAEPPRTANRIVRAFFNALDAKHIPMHTLASRLGISGVTATSWRHGKSSPRLDDFENACELAGYRLTLTPMEPQE